MMLPAVPFGSSYHCAQRDASASRVSNAQRRTFHDAAARRRPRGRGAAASTPAAGLSRDGGTSSRSTPPARRGRARLGPPCSGLAGGRRASGPGAGMGVRRYGRAPARRVPGRRRDLGAPCHGGPPRHRAARVRAARHPRGRPDFRQLVPCGNPSRARDRRHCGRPDFRLALRSRPLGGGPSTGFLRPRLQLLSGAEGRRFADTVVEQGGSFQQGGPPREDPKARREATLPPSNQFCRREYCYRAYSHDLFERLCFPGPDVGGAAVDFLVRLKAEHLATEHGLC